jgi:hypothetical protein
MKSDPTAGIDSRLSHLEADTTPWSDARQCAGNARAALADHAADRRTAPRDPADPRGGARMHFRTGLREHRAGNLEYQREVVLSTATPALAVSTSSVEGPVVRVVDQDALQRLADAYEAKYGSAFSSMSAMAYLTRARTPLSCSGLNPAKVLASAREPHSQASYRFTGR